MTAPRWFLYTAAALGAMASLARADDAVHWQPTLEAARQVAAQTNRLVLIHFWSTSCKPCMRLEKNVLSKPEVAAALEANFVPVKLDVEESPGTARAYGVSSIPADVIVSPSGQLVSQALSPPTAHQYVAQLDRVAAGYRDLTGQTPVAMGMQPPAATSNGAPAPDPSMAPNVPSSQSVYGSDRYAEYYNKQPQGPPPVSPAIPPNDVAQATSVGPYPPGAPTAMQLSPDAAPPQQSYAPPPPQPYGPPPGQERFAPQAVAPQLPPGSPPVGLEGFCPVTLLERRAWTPGNPAYGAVHRGRTYLFIGPEQAQRFLANPDHYSPVLSGNDPVLALDNRVAVPGRREFGVFSGNRIYLFANQESRKRFEQNPNRYAPEIVQAMR